MNRNHLKVFLWILAIFWMGVIFLFSSQNAEESNKVSGSTVEFIAKTVINDYETLGDNQKQKIVESMAKHVRKAAHFFEYAVLGMIYILLALQYNIKNKIPVCLCCAVAYACTDEFHQKFIPGRAMRASDVLIDSVGALFGIVVILLVARLCKKFARKGKKKNEENYA